MSAVSRPPPPHRPERPTLRRQPHRKWNHRPPVSPLISWRVYEAVRPRCCSLPRKRSARLNWRSLWAPVALSLPMMPVHQVKLALSLVDGSLVSWLSVVESIRGSRLSVELAAGCPRRGNRSSWPTRSPRWNSPLRLLFPSV